MFGRNAAAKQGSARIGADERYRSVRTILWVIMGLNLAVALAKYLYGTATGSVSMRADGIASVFDAASNIIGLLGLALAARPADANHPYGHAKYETYASAVIGVMLLAAAYNVFTDAYAAFTAPEHTVEVNAGSFVVMLGTLAVNLGVSAFERKRGRELQSELLSADAMHTASDTLVSTSVIVGLIFTMMGYPLADPICSLIVGVAILKSALDVFRQANVALSDEARVSPSLAEQCALRVEGVRNCHAVRSRGTEGDVHMDLHILVDPEITVEAGHGIATNVERAIRYAYPQVSDVLVHVEPDCPTERARV